MQSYIFDYESNITEDDSEVLKGIKFEIVDVPILEPLVKRRGRSGRRVPSVLPIETGVGKLAAIGTLSTRRDNYPDLVRHAHDLAELSSSVSAGVSLDLMKRLVNESNITIEDVVHGLEELQRPIWESHYNDYMRRMGKLDVGAFPPSHPLWEEVLDDLNHLAYDLGIVKDPNIPARKEEEN